MRAEKPNLNHHYYFDDYLGAFGFKSLGKNVKIHRTVVLPDPPSVSIGDNVEIGPYCVLWGKEIDIGDNVVIGPLCILDGEHVEVPSDTIVQSGSGLDGTPLFAIAASPKRGRKS